MNRIKSLNFHISQNNKFLGLLKLGRKIVTYEATLRETHHELWMCKWIWHLLGANEIHAFCLICQAFLFGNLK